MLTPDDAGTILSVLGVLKMQSVEESSSSNISTPRQVEVPWRMPPLYKVWTS